MTGQQIQFHQLRERTLVDQKDAMAAGYASVYEFAIDKLAGMVLELTARVEKLEKLVKQPDWPVRTDARP